MTSPLPNDAAAIAYFRSPEAIRDRSGYLFDLALADRLDYFRCDLHALNAVAEYVIQVMRRDYPNLDVPFHSRWRHFEIANVPRLSQLQQEMADVSALEQARIQFDLAIVSVLLDAGAGDRWRYRESETDLVLRRSEGLAIASYHLFRQGCFSSQPDEPLRVDASKLMALTEIDLVQGFQVSDKNPLVGLSGRLALLHQLGQALMQHPDLFGSETPRPGGLVDYLLTQTQDQQISAATVLETILIGLGDIWPGRLNLAGVNLGDVWHHPALADLDPQYPYVPFHKLSQWLTYSLLEPLQALGLQIYDLDRLTGLPEYRNGGLCLDLGLLQVKDPNLYQRVYPPDSIVIVEWRSLTVILLDRIATTIRQILGMSAADLPLVKVLQGGTWSAGRQIAAQKRAGGPPPLQLKSDGTVF